ncbi:phage portal protein [Nonomuraea pusilla]|uniref:Phage portal protein, SPP1 Gp6-like n=1 Tax=Nonomuraea pusilla TaxID=46177 RepID=A0A1H8JY95_9ACTN|nr:phage portal protein [Nonomuraea pusilla]SEN85672.1 Phage portal protein, SPP1 Gp6-like [Nonomuraea pusilla]
MVARSALEWLMHLIKCHDRDLPELKKWDAYYEGEQPLSYMAPELLQELDERVRQVVVEWPRLVADSVEERLDIEGFRFGRQAEADEELWRIWQANDLDEESQKAHVDALVMGRSYVIVGANEDDANTPIVTVESPLEVYAEHDPRTRKVAAAVKRWTEEDENGKVEHATLYLPGVTVWWVKRDGDWVEDPDHGRDEHELDEVPVVPIVNRPRTKRPNGVSELKPIVPLSDAACKMATDMMVSGEFHAVPRRWAIGVDESDFQDEQGRKISALKRIIGRVWAIPKHKQEDGVEVGQFPEANLANFHETLKLLAMMVASLGGLPSRFLGHATDNPASADAIRSDESRLIKRAERRQRSYGGSWERVQRLVLKVRGDETADDAKSLETLWRDAATPTIAQKADAAVKLYTAKIVPLHQTREDLGYTQVQIERMEEEDEKVAENAFQRVMAGDLAALTGPKPPQEKQPEPEPVA